MTLSATLRLSLLLSSCLLLTACPFEDVSKLAGTKYGAGRAPGSAGSIRSQDWIIQRVQPHAQGLLSGSGSNAFKQSYGSGTNILAQIPGTDLADEYIIIGAHYDHLGSSCTSSKPGDYICNGATDNAAGVAAVLQIARAIADDGFQNRRTLILAFWDEEEAGLIGSEQYLNNPPVPLEDTVAYVNMDIMGSNLLPGLVDASLIAAAESGGSMMQNIVDNAIPGHGLHIRQFNARFSDNRSDHTNFLARDIPSVFMTDAIGACYHTAQDSVDKVDFDKLDRQIDIISSITRNLLNSETQPQFTEVAIDREDAQELVSLFQAVSGSTSRFSHSDRQRYNQIVQQAQAAANSASNELPQATQDQLLIAARDYSRILRAGGACEAFF